MDNDPVTTDAGPMLRRLRAVVLAVVATALGSVAHLLAGGRLPGVVGYGVLLALLVLAAAPLLARAASTRRVVALVVVGQSVVHAVLTATSGHAGDGVGTAASHTAVRPAIPESVLTSTHRVGTLADQLHPQPAGVDGGATVPDWVLHLLADLQPAQLPMALAHLLAAVGVGLWLASGERALFTLLTLAAAPLLRLLAPLVLAAPARPQAPRAHHALRVVRREVLLASSVARRGPPVLPVRTA